MLSKANREKVKDIIRHPYACPGGYERIAITDDGGLLCHRCVKDNYRLILGSSQRDGWHVEGFDLVENYDEEPIYCDNCGKFLGIETGETK